jgi:hypothetical protein
LNLSSISSCSWRLFFAAADPAEFAVPPSSVREITWVRVRVRVRVRFGVMVREWEG